MKRSTKILIGLIIMIFFSIISSLCSLLKNTNLDVTVAKDIGGTAKIFLPPNRKLIAVDWKTGDSLWILTREFHKGETPDIYYYQEDSKFGIIESTIIIKEVKDAE